MLAFVSLREWRKSSWAISDRLRYTTAVSEIQLWVEPTTGPRYEDEDGLIWQESKASNFGNRGL